MSEKMTAVGDYDLMEGADENYRALYPGALVCLALAVLSATAFLHPVWVVLTVAAIAIGVFSLWAIARQPESWTGRNLALAGTLIALFCLAGGVTRQVTREKTILDGANATALEWFSYLAHDEPHKAFQLQVEPQKRLPLDGHLWKSYLDSPKLNDGLHQLVKNPPIQALLALGKNAKPRPYSLLAHRERRSGHELEELFVVTYEQEGKRRSFFLKMNLSRDADPVTGLIGWKVNSAMGPSLPDDMKPPARR